MTTHSHNSPPPRRAKSALRRFLQTVVLTSVVITGGLSALRLLGVLEAAEISAYDSFINWQPPEPPDERILVVGISEADIQGRKEYPIKEGTVVDLITTLEQYQPRVIGLDFALDFPQGTEADRAELTDLLASSNHIISACVMSSANHPGVPHAPGVTDDLVAFADFPQDKDGVVRRSLLVSTPGEVFVDELVRSHLCNEPGVELLSLSFLSSLIYLEFEEIFPDQTPAGDLVWGDTLIAGLSERAGGYASTGAVDYQIMINFRAPQNAVNQVSLTEVLNDDVDPDWIRDRIVLVGYTSPVVNDIFTTPYTKTTAGFRGMPGVVVHAQATSQLISAVLDGRPLITSWPELGEILLMGVSSIAAGALALYSRRWFMTTVVGGVGIAVLWGAAYALLLQGFWLPVVPMTIASLVSVLVVSLLSQARQSVYAQAIFEQLKAEITGQHQAKSSSQRDRLDNLVQRAQSIRQRRGIVKTLESNDMERLEKDPLHMTFNSPEVQTFYEQIKTHLQHQFDEEKATLTSQSQQQSGSNRSQKLKALVAKSQNTRIQTTADQPLPGPAHHE